MALLINKYGGGNGLLMSALGAKKSLAISFANRDFATVFKQVNANFHSSFKTSVSSDPKVLEAFGAVLTAASSSHATVSDVTTISSSERRAKCTANVTLYFGFPDPKAAEDKNRRELLEELVTLSPIRQARRFEVTITDEGKTLVEVFRLD